MSERKFPLRVVLSVTTGRLLTKPRGDHDNGIGDLYEILGFMCEDAPYSHQLGRFSAECKSWLLRWYPDLESPELLFEVGKLIEMLSTPSGRDKSEALIDGWLSGLVSSWICRESYMVQQIPRDDHEQKHPYDELVQMSGTTENIILVEATDDETKQ